MRITSHTHTTLYQPASSPLHPLHPSHQGRPQAHVDPPLAARQVSEGPGVRQSAVPQNPPNSIQGKSAGSTVGMSPAPPPLLSEPRCLPPPPARAQAATTAARVLVAGSMGRMLVGVGTKRAPPSAVLDRGREAGRGKLVGASSGRHPHGVAGQVSSAQQKAQAACHCCLGGVVVVCTPEPSQAQPYLSTPLSSTYRPINTPQPN